ncbi:MAG: hypothetical protein M3O15_13620 [Acidobacteriota bacterium]|nr:hypothetical protein [Acidobacteriota bacterium]
MSTRVGFIGLGGMGRDMTHRLVQAGRQEPPGSKLLLGLKDLRLVLDAVAEEVRLPLPLGSLIHAHLPTALDRGQEELDGSSFARVAAGESGPRRA